MGAVIAGAAVRIAIYIGAIMIGGDALLRHLEKKEKKHEQH